MTATYGEIRRVLELLDFAMVRSRKHETWERITPAGAILRVSLSHKGHRDVPAGTLAAILRQAGIDRETFLKLLKA